MKKKIASLLTLTLLCLSLLLTSCAKAPCTEPHVDADYNGVCDVCKNDIPMSLFNLYKHTELAQSVGSATAIKTIDILGEPVGDAKGFNSFTDEILYTEETVTTALTAEQNGGTAGEYTEKVMRVYNLNTGTIIIERRVRTSSTNVATPPEALRGSNVSFPGEEMPFYGGKVPKGLIFVEETTYDNKHNFAFYNTQGQIVAEAKDVSSDLPVTMMLSLKSDRYFILAGKLYNYKDGAATLACDLLATGIHNTLSGANVYKVGDKFCAVKTTNAGAVHYLVYDASFNLLKNYSFDREYGNNTNTYYSVLANANLLIVRERTLSLEALNKDSKYDFIVGNTAYSRNTYVWSYETGELSETANLPFYTYSIKNLATENTVSNASFNDTLFNMVVSGMPIVDGHVMYMVETYELKGDGTLGRRLAELDGLEAEYYDIAPVPGVDAYVVETPYGYSLYKTDGTKIGNLPGFELSSKNSNYKWIYNSNNRTIYSYELAEILKVELGYEILSESDTLIGRDVLYFKKHFDADPNVAESKAYTQYYLFDGTMKEIAKIEDGSTDSVFVPTDMGYMIMSNTVNEANKPVQSFKIYKTDTTLLGEISATDTDTVENTFEELALSYIGERNTICFYQVIETTNEDSSVTTAYKLHIIK